MKKGWSIIKNILTYFIVAVAVCTMIYTVFSLTSNDQKERAIFGYKMFVVLSDSMSATDFSAGDLIFVKEVDPQTLKSGDIIAFTSQAKENFGETVAHKIRNITMDREGNPGFITYGTTTGIDDEVVVTYEHVLGLYRMRIPIVGRFLSFVKTIPGYILFILLPFLALIISQGINCFKILKEDREEELKLIHEERDKLLAEREELKQMVEKLEERRIR